MSDFEAAARRSIGARPARGICRKCRGFGRRLRGELGQWRVWRICDDCKGTGER